VFVRNLGRQATANPLPVALIGAGVAWLMLSNGRQPANSASINRAAETAIDRARQSMTDAGARIGEFSQQAGAQAQEVGPKASERVSDWASDTTGRVTDTRRRFSEMTDSARRTAEQSVQDARSRASQAASSISESASSAYETAKSSAADTYGRVADRAKQATSQMGNSVSGVGQRTAGASRDLLEFCKTQPLVLAGLGMALGAIIGALIPATETEDELMGRKSDQLKNQAGELAKNQYERAKDVVESGFDQAKAKPSGAQPPEHPETSLVPGAEQSGSKEPAE
jgi:ElaB/YqjD/DUF883 family membrane-anchored ribosome-binding protein